MPKKGSKSEDEDGGSSDDDGQQEGGSSDGGEVTPVTPEPTLSGGADFGFWDQQHDCFKDKQQVDLLMGK